MTNLKARQNNTSGGWIIALYCRFFFHCFAGLACSFVEMATVLMLFMNSGQSEAHEFLWLSLYLAIRTCYEIFILNLIDEEISSEIFCIKNVVPQLKLIFIQTGHAQLLPFNLFGYGLIILVCIFLFTKCFLLLSPCN